MDQCKYDCNYSLQPESAVVHTNHANGFTLNIFWNTLLLYVTFYFQTATAQKIVEKHGELQLLWDLQGLPPSFLWAWGGLIL